MRRTEKICYALAVLSLLLGLLLRFVFTSVRFTGLLLCCGAAALMVFALLTRWKERCRWALWLRRAFLCLLAVGFAFFAVMEVRVISWARTDDAPAAALVVFGAGVNGREPSLTLRSRLEAALAYAGDKPDMPIVVSGAQGRGEDVSEARCMADWLIERGMDPGRVWLEEQAVNTRENVRYSMRLLAERGIDIKDPIAFCTSDYHMCRAVHLSGQPDPAADVVPVAARLPDRYWPLTVNYYIREAFAMAAAIVFQ